MNKVVLLAPCTIYAKPPPGALEIWTAGLDIYELSGPNWTDDKAKACTVTSKEVCESLDYYDDKQPTSLKLNVQMAQIKSMKRFQEFAEDWPQSRKGREIKLSEIKEIPVSMYVA